MSELTEYKPALTIHVLWCQEQSRAKDNLVDALSALAHSVFEHFNRNTENPLERGMGIPVFLHNPLPPDISILEQSQHCILVVLIDDHMVIADKWCDALSQFAKAITAACDRHFIYPVAITENAFNLATLNTTNFIRLQKLVQAQWVEHLNSRLTHELCRVLINAKRGNSGLSVSSGRISPAPVMMFLSHAKADGNELAVSLRDHIKASSAVASFYDTNDIAPGFDFRQEIEGNIERSVLVVLQTDKYASRTWCRKEVLWAKAKGCPLVVINAVQNGEQRSFPYLGNTPTLRLDNNDSDWCNKVLQMALTEMLRHLWFNRHLAVLSKLGMVPKGLVASPNPPEVITLLQRDVTPSVIIYPDPPLAVEETQLLALAAPNLTLTTPTSCASGLKQTQPLLGLTIGISISDSPDLALLGLSQAHVQDVMLELARYLLAQGANLAYGGDLRPEGVTEQLLALIGAYNSHNDESSLSRDSQGRQVQARLQNYVAWPLTLNFSTAILAKYHLQGVFKLIEPADELHLSLEQRSTFVPPDTSEHRYWWYRSLSKMRKEMARHLDARVILGGQLRGYAGGQPGLVEEVLLSLKHQQPLYLIGGMGGCSREIIHALQGQRPKKLQLAYQSEGEDFSDYGQFVDYVANLPTPDKIDYQAILDQLNRAGVGGLNNGLSEQENKRLFVTPHVSEIVSLVLKGLSRCTFSAD